MALSAQDPKLLEVIGSFLGVAVGAVDGSSTSSVVTVPQLKNIKGVICTGFTSATAPYCSATSGNTFTVTHASNDDFCWLAWGDPNC